MAFEPAMTMAVQDGLFLAAMSLISVAGYWLLWPQRPSVDRAATVAHSQDRT